MEFVHIYRNGYAVGHTYMDGDQVRAEITPRRTQRDPVGTHASCAHGQIVHAFAHRRSSDEHWPVAYCGGCLTLLAGRDPFARAETRPRWKFDERNVIATRWKREWPKRGRPRGAPPESTAWPDAA